MSDTDRIIEALRDLPGRIERSIASGMRMSGGGGAVPNVGLPERTISESQLQTFLPNLIKTTVDATKQGVSLETIQQQLFSRESTIGAITGGGVDFMRGLRDPNKFGLTFADDAGKALKVFSDHKMGAESYISMISKAPDRYARMMGSVDRTAFSLSDVATKFLDYGGYLQSSGVYVEELNEILAASAIGFSARELADTQSSQKLRGNALVLSETLLDLSKITGKHRDQIREAVAAEKEKEDMRVLLEDLPAEARRGIEVALATAYSSMGDRGVQLFSEIIRTGGPLTKESGMLMSALGPAGDKLIQLLTGMTGSTTNEQTTQLLGELPKLISAASESVMGQLRQQPYARETEYGRVVMDIGRELRPFRAQQDVLTDLLTKQGKTVTPEDVERLRLQMASQAKVGLGPTGEADPGKTLIRGAREVEQGVQSFASATTLGMSKLSDKIGELIVKFDELIPQIGAAASTLKTREGVIEAPGKMLDFVRDLAQKAPDLKPQIMEGVRSSGLLDMVPDEIKKQFKDVMGFQSGTPDITSFLSGGQYLQGVDFKAGTLAMLHGRESVVPVDKWGEIQEKMVAMQTPAIDTTQTTILSDMRSMMATLAKSMAETADNTRTLIDASYKQTRTIRQASPNQLA